MQYPPRLYRFTSRLWSTVVRFFDITGLENRGPSFFGPRARREATFFLVFFPDAHFRPFREPFSAFGTHFGDLGLSETYVFLR